ncbi:MAG: polysaccharide biosynthesis C-terminal domain-containing protein [Crocinitomicaceae bacterium]|nr:polysaccharide biosynthesis C-terminal domain-containing protein [Crocinitomicaceae bacterium]
MTANSKLNSFLSIAIHLSGLGIGLLTNVLLARGLGPKGYGDYSLAYTIIAYIALPLEVGFAMVMVREISSSISSQHWGHVRGAIRASFTVPIFYFLICLSLSVLAFLVKHTEEHQYFTTALYALILLLLLGLTVAIGSVLRGIGYPLWGQSISSFLRPAVFFTLLVALLLNRTRINFISGFTPNSILLIQIISLVFVLGIAIFLLNRFRPLELKHTAAKYKWKGWLTDVAGYSLMSIVMSTNQGLSIMLLSYFTNSEDLGIYRIAELGASLVALPIGALSIHFSAHISRLLATKNILELQQSTKHLSKVALSVALPLALMLIMLSSEYLPYLFGKSFIGAMIPMNVLIIAQVVNTFTGPTGIVLNMGGHHRDIITAISIACIIQLVLSAILIPRYSLFGAAASSLISTLIWTQILRYRVKKIYNISTLPL